MESDEDLVERVAEGDRRAFRVLMDRYIGRAMRLSQRVTGVASIADDVAQEAFLRVWMRAEHFDPKKARFTTWLHRIVVNLAIDERRRPHHEPIDDLSDAVGDDPTQLTAMIADEERRAIDFAIAALPARQRAAIALFYGEGLSGRDAAAALDVSEKAFESLLSRARAAVRAACTAETKTTGASRDDR